jgi:hypothetical protein
MTSRTKAAVRRVRARSLRNARLAGSRRAVGEHVLDQRPALGHDLAEPLDDMADLTAEDALDPLFDER